MPSEGGKGTQRAWTGCQMMRSKENQGNLECMAPRLHSVRAAREVTSRRDSESVLFRKQRQQKSGHERPTRRKKGLCVCVTRMVLNRLEEKEKTPSCVITRYKGMTKGGKRMEGVSVGAEGNDKLKWHQRRARLDRRCMDGRQKLPVDGVHCMGDSRRGLAPLFARSPRTTDGN